MPRDAFLSIVGRRNNPLGCLGLFLVAGLAVGLGWWLGGTWGGVGAGSCAWLAGLGVAVRREWFHLEHGVVLFVILVLLVLTVLAVQRAHQIEKLEQDKEQSASAPTEERQARRTETVTS